MYPIPNNNSPPSLDGFASATLRLLQLNSAGIVYWSSIQQVYAKYVHCMVSGSHQLLY